MIATTRTEHATQLENLAFDKLQARLSAIVAHTDPGDVDERITFQRWSLERLHEALAEAADFRRDKCPGCSGTGKLPEPEPTMFAVVGAHELGAMVDVYPVSVLVPCAACLGSGDLR